MTSTLGNTLQSLALVFSVVSALMLIAGSKRPSSRLARTGYAFVYASFALLTACVGIVLMGMLTEDYTLAYVVSNYPATGSPLPGRSTA